MLLSEVGMATASRSGRKKRGTNLDRALDQRFARYGLTRSDAPRWDPAPLENARYQPCSGRGGLLAPAKFAAIAPHPVQDDDVLDNMAHAALGFVLVVPRNELRRRAG
jgi:hypothetical protein